MTFLIAMFILVMQFLWLYIDELVGKGLGFSVILEFLAWGSATVIPLALPLATLLSSIMTLGGLGENNELLAMKAAGVPLLRILLPLSVVAVLISTGAFFAANNLIPVSYKKIYTLRDDINKTKDEIKIPTGMFYDGIDNYILRINERDKETDMLYNIMVYNHSSNNGNHSVTIADSGMIKFTPDKKNAVFTLYGGTSYEEDEKINTRDTIMNLQKIRFKHQDIVIPLENYAFERSDDNKFGNQIMAKGTKALKKDKDSLTIQYDSTLILQKSRTFTVLSLRHPEQLDSLRNDSLQNYENVYSLFDSLSTSAKINTLNAAKSSLASAQSTFSNYSRELRQYAYPLRRTEVEFFRKYTLSLACLIFFFIGAPMGAIIRKGGLGTPMIISALFFVFYWVIDISGKKLANDGAVSPFFGTFVSTMVLLPIGIFLTYKSTKDSALFNTDAYKVLIKKIAKKFERFKKKKK